MKTEKNFAVVYYVDKNSFKEAMLTFAFRKRINWLEEGLSVLSWKYHRIKEFKQAELSKLYKYMKNWNGNKKSKIAGHRAISIGDIVQYDDIALIITGYGWERIPDCIWNKIVKIKN